MISPPGGVLFPPSLGVGDGGGGERGRENGQGIQKPVMAGFWFGFFRDRNLFVMLRLMAEVDEKALEDGAGVMYRYYCSNKSWLEL